MTGTDVRGDSRQDIPPDAAGVNVDSAGPAPRAWFRRGPVLAAGAIVGGWALSGLAGWLHLHWLTLTVVVVGTASLLRGARTVLDRLVITFAVLSGLLCALTLGLSVWPWGLNPTVLGGTAITGLVLVAAATGRRPRPPRWPTGPDWVSVAGTTAFGGMLLSAFAGQDITGRLSLVMRSEDLSRHYIMYDAIRRFDGYTFLNWDVARSSVHALDRGYPAGAHVVTAVLDNFVTSSRHPDADPLAALSRFIWYDVAWYTLLALAVLWAAKRIAGPAATALGFLPIAATTVAYLLFTEVSGAFLFGFLPELAGLALLAVLIALAARPLTSTREQLLALGAVSVAVAFTYYLLLPIAAVALLGYAWIARRRLRRHWVFTAVLAVPTGVLCVVPYAVNSSDVGWRMVITPFGIIRVERPPVLALFALALLAGLLTRRWWRTPSMIVSGGAVGAAAAICLVVGALQLHHTGETSYFLDKSLHTLIVVLLIALGGLAPAVSRIDRTHQRGGVVAVVVAATLAVVPLAGLGALERNVKLTPGTSPDPQQGTSWGRALISGRLVHPEPASNAVRAQRYIGGRDGRINLIETATGDDPRAMIYLAALQGNFASTFDSFIWSFPNHTPAEYEALITGNPQHRYRVLTSNDELLTALRELRQRRPELGLDVVDIRTLNG